MLNTSPITPPKADFMNPPKNALELKEELLQELEEKKKEGKHREWFETLVLRWLSREDSDRALTAIASCLQENPVEGFSDEDFVALATQHTTSANDQVKNLYRLYRDLMKRKFVIDRNSPVVKNLTFLNGTFSFLPPFAVKFDGETFSAEILLLSEALALTGKPEETTITTLSVWEETMLQQPNIEAAASCFRSGFFVPEKAEMYLDYIFTKGAKELTPLFVSFKFKHETQEEEPCTP